MEKEEGEEEGSTQTRRGRHNVRQCGRQPERYKSDRDAQLLAVSSNPNVRVRRTAERDLGSLLKEEMEEAEWGGRSHSERHNAMVK